MAKPKICSIPECGKPAASRGWCDAHYRRWRLFGGPERGGPIGTSKGDVLRFYEDVVLEHAGDECLLWPYKSKSGFGYAVIRIRGKQHLVHRLACEHIHGPAPAPKYEVAHNCGNGHLGCVNPHHLRWATRSENHADKLEHGTHNRGEQSMASKLTDDDVRAIRALEGHKSCAKIAGQFGVCPQQVHRIHRRERWAWLD